MSVSRSLFPILRPNAFCAAEAAAASVVTRSAMNATPRLRLLASLTLLTAFAGVSAPARADLPVAQTPLYLAAGVDPAFIMAVDDSGSMDGEGSYITNDGALWWHTGNRSFIGLDRTDTASAGTLNFNLTGASGATWKKYVYLFPNGQAANPTDRRVYNDGGFDQDDHFAVPPTLAFAFTRSSEYNAAYFDPATTYAPWSRQDGTQRESYNTTAEFGAVPFDPGRGTNTANLTANFALFGANETFRMYQGMVIPAGTRYYVRARNEDANCPNATFGTFQTWNTAPAGGLTIQDGTGGPDDEEACDVGFNYFPATFYLKATTALPAGYGYIGVPIAGAIGPGGEALLGYEIKSANFTAGFYDAAMTNFADWFAYYRKRHLAARAGLTQSFVDTTALRAGYFEINDRNDVTMMDMNVTADRTALYNSFVTLQGNGGTPNRESVSYFGDQFNRTTALNGAGATTATAAGAPIVQACQKNFGMLFTDGFSNASAVTTPPGNFDGGANAHFQANVFRDTASDSMADLAASLFATRFRTDLPAGQVSISNTCDITDPKQDCNRDLHMNFFGITLGSRGIEYGINAAATADPYVTKPTWPTTFTNRHPSAVDDIWHASINGRGRFLNARTPADIAAAMKEVLAVVADSSQPAGGTAASGARRDSGFLVYVPKYDSGDWTGDVEAYQLAPGGALVQPYLWSAAARLPAPSDRNIFVSMPALTGTAKVLKTFVKSNLGTTDAAAAATLGFGTGTGQTPLPTGATIDQAIAYLRGDDTRMQPAAGGVFRERTTKIGDILNSQPAVLDRGSRGYVGLPTADGGGASGSGSYGAFVTTTKKNRTPVVFVGTNGGMLHAFDGSTHATNGGKELFAVIPNSVLSNLNRLVQPNYVHRYYVDASPELGDARLSGAWKSVLLAGNGGGGKSIMALDVTDPSTAFATTNMLWEFTERDLGLTYGRPQIVLLEDGNWYAAFGNGFNSTGDPTESITTRGHDAYLYLVRLDDPTTFYKIRAATGDDSVPTVHTSQNGLGSVTAIDTDFDLKSDVIYAPDYKGNVWKFDLSSATPGSWAVAFSGSPLYTARYTSTGTPLQNITGSIDVTLHHLSGYMVYFGTGKYFLTGDNVVPATNAPIETFYAIWDNEASTVTGRTTLVQQTIDAESLVTGIGSVRTTSENVIDWSTKRGWYLDLKVGSATDGRGERFVGQPRVDLGRVIFTTFVPLGGVCEPGGRNWLYALSAINGANDISFGGSPACDNCGGIGLTDTGGSEAPALSPPIVADPGVPPAATPCPVSDPTCIPPTPGCIPGVDPNCPLPAAGAAIPGRVCTVNLSVVMPTGAKAFSQVSCGRQSWRQLQ